MSVVSDFAALSDVHLTTFSTKRIGNVINAVQRSRSSWFRQTRAGAWLFLVSAHSSWWHIHCRSPTFFTWELPTFNIDITALYWPTLLLQVTLFCCTFSVLSCCRNGWR